MAEGRFIAYYRVSTARQGRSGLGLEAQREAVRSYLNGGAWSLVAEVTEVESGKRNDRPKLAEALRLCRLHKATLIIAKLDRLARNVAFVSSLMDSGVEFTAVDFPQANRLTVHILAAVAEHEAKAISERTRSALARKREWYDKLDEAAKDALIAAGKRTRLGGDGSYLATASERGRLEGLRVRQAKATSRAQDLAGIIAAIRAEGAVSLRDIAEGLNQRGIPTAKGGAWAAVQVSRVLAKLDNDDTAQRDS
ncbi:recombinase family protein [Methylobacterium sp. GC_Met_2]|uniref:recombinase family protein n=1 Tax=Methylobacterium sp. GC_Met_2 TaxID=2937376 RepID=UPI00226B035D|nr:recombinase family protein [Methylobacterium sp. GC_Met_2]